MKAFLFGTATVVAAALFCGCPVYSHEEDSRVCTSDGCFDCPDPTYSGACKRMYCTTSADCPQGAFCSRENMCSVGGAGGASIGAGCTTPSDCPSGSTCGWDGTCHAGDCSGDVGCPSGYQCSVSGGRAHCEGSIGSDSGAGSRESGAAGASVDGSPPEGGAAPYDGGVPDAGGDAISASPPGSSCNWDWQCAGGGAKCIEGQCTAADHLCTDAIQCPAASPLCEDGRCTPRCSAGAPCPTGFACDFTRGACSVNPSVCTCNAQCLGGTTCVEGHCVAPCPTGDAEVACPGGQVCINSGCLPQERGLPSCKN